MRKRFTFWQKRSLTRSFYGSPPPPTSLGSDRWVRREGYGGPNVGEFFLIVFDLYSIDKYVIVDCFIEVGRYTGDARVRDSRNCEDWTHALKMQRNLLYGTNFTGDHKLGRPIIYMASKYA